MVCQGITYTSEFLRIQLLRVCAFDNVDVSRRQSHLCSPEDRIGLGRRQRCTEFLGEQPYPGSRTAAAPGDENPFGGSIRIELPHHGSHPPYKSLDDRASKLRCCMVGRNVAPRSIACRQLGIEDKSSASWLG